MDAGGSSTSRFFSRVSFQLFNPCIVYAGGSAKPRFLILARNGLASNSPVGKHPVVKSISYLRPEFPPLRKANQLKQELILNFLDLS